MDSSSNPKDFSLTLPWASKNVVWGCVLSRRENRSACVNNAQEAVRWFGNLANKQEFYR